MNLENTIHKVERSSQDAASVKKSLLASFPFLAPHPEVVGLLSKWKEWYVGVLDEDVDPAEYDSFSLAPIEELHWRTEWQQVGFLTVAIFFVKNIETDVVVRTSSDAKLYTLRRDDASHLVVCPMHLQQILDGVEHHRQTIDQFLAFLTKGCQTTEVE